MLLTDQDRSRWNGEWRDRGLVHLCAAMAAERLTPTHLEAGIAACHTSAASWEETDWQTILGFYDCLLEIAPSPVIALNRAVALAMVDGPEAALEALVALAAEPDLERYYLLAATQAELIRRIGRFDASRRHLETAVELAPTTPVRDFLEARLAELP